MTTIFKKTSVGTELVGEAKPRRKTGIQAPDPRKQEAQRNKHKAKNDEARRVKAKKAAIRKKNSIKQDKQRLLTQNIFSLAKFSQKDAFEKLKHFSQAGLTGLRKLAEEISIAVSEKKKDSILKVLAQIKKVEKLRDTLESEQLNRDNSESIRLKNRKLTARLANEHPLGKIIGRVNIVEYKAPGSTTWATPRKRR